VVRMVHQPHLLKYPLSLSRHDRVREVSRRRYRDSGVGMALLNIDIMLFLCPVPLFNCEPECGFGVLCKYCFSMLVYGI
jgi:hypothetical protein